MMNSPLKTCLTPYRSHVLPLLNRCGWTKGTLTYVIVSDLSDLACDMTTITTCEMARDLHGAVVPTGAWG